MCCLFPRRNPSTLLPKNILPSDRGHCDLFLRLTGATARGGGASAASYLLFEQGFCRKLIDHRDARRAG